MYHRPLDQAGKKALSNPCCATGQKVEETPLSGRYKKDLRGIDAENTETTGYSRAEQQLLLFIAECRTQWKHGQQPTCRLLCLHLSHNFA